MHAITDVVVVVPAANEATRIGPCLDSIARAAERVTDVDVRVVVALDRCTDRTADVVAQHPGVRTIGCSARSVGVARAVGTQQGLTLMPSPHTTWFANTDADSIVPSDWLTHMLDAADAGWDLVVGTVVPGPELPADIRRSWTSRHLTADGHRHVHGANLGIRADVYLTLGGWAPLTTGEDVDLVARADAAGLAVYRSGRCPVTTSARPTGRAPHGFSSYLRDLAAVGDPER